MSDGVRRKNIKPLSDWSEGFDTFDDVDPIRLRYWAGICLEFNHSERTLTDCMSLLSGIEASHSDVITSRINSIEGKADIVKYFARESYALEGEAADLICHSVGFLLSCKTYRDAIAHAYMQGPEATIVYTYVRKGVQYEVDLDIDTLRSVYSHVVHCDLQMALSYRMAEHSWTEDELIDRGRTKLDIINSEDYQKCILELRIANASRAKLPAIPKLS
jgi:hypothetical protein